VKVKAPGVSPSVKHVWYWDYYANLSFNFLGTMEIFIINLGIHTKREEWFLEDMDAFSLRFGPYLRTGVKCLEESTQTQP
jgi:hypothetical protein